MGVLEERVTNVSGSSWKWEDVGCKGMVVVDRGGAVVLVRGGG